MESIWNDMDSIWIPHGMWGASQDLLLLVLNLIYGQRHLEMIVQCMVPPRRAGLELHGGIPHDQASHCDIRLNLKYTP